jgi:cyclic pyranopterin phosphate synthase
MSETADGGTAGAVARLVSVNVSERTGMKKAPVQQASIELDRGIAGDAHAGDWHRQVSLLALESIGKMRAAGAEVGPGDFAENLTVEGLDLLALPIGTELAVGDDVRLVLTQHGKECHDRCAIYEQVGDCVMPREGVFAIVVRAGDVAPGDRVEVRSRGTGSYERTDAGGN